MSGIIYSMSSRQELQQQLEAEFPGSDNQRIRDLITVDHEALHNTNVYLASAAISRLGEITTGKPKLHFAVFTFLNGLTNSHNPRIDWDASSPIIALNHEL